MENENYKFVEYEKWCNTCKHKDEPDDHPEDGKCNECLAEPARLFSHKPVNYEKK